MQPFPLTPLYTSLIYDLPGKFGAWPSIARTAAGELLVVFSGDRRHHVDPYGKTLLVRSSDNGRTWTPPQVINNSPLDDRDPGIVVLPDGSWLVSLFTSQLYATWKDAVAYYGQQEVNQWQPYIERLTSELNQQYLGYFTLLSRDQGGSWSGLRRAPVTAPHGPIVGAQGELLFLGNHRQAGKVSIVCYVSTDQGTSWLERGVLAAAHALEGIYLCEPHLAQLPDGRLLGQLRVNAAEVEKRQLMQSVSSDGGRSWSPVETTGIWGLPPHLLQHSSGVLLSSFGHRRAPFGQRVALSYDGGQSWPKLLSLATFACQPRTTAEDVGEIYYQIPDLGYPATVELADGSLYTVWYQSRPAGNDALILGCCWRLPEFREC
jgi:hypothetical protein